MSDALSKQLWVDTKPKTPDTPDHRVEQALQKALDATTPDRPGVPWDEDVSERRRDPGYVIPGGGHEEA